MENCKTNPGTALTTGDMALETKPTSEGDGAVGEVEVDGDDVEVEEGDAEADGVVREGEASSEEDVSDATTGEAASPSEAVGDKPRAIPGLKRGPFFPRNEPLLG